LVAATVVKHGFAFLFSYKGGISELKTFLTFEMCNTDREKTLHSSDKRLMSIIPAFFLPP
jgi:hypothetical protein